MMDSFSPTFKWIVSRITGSTSWSCEIEVSDMGKGERITCTTFLILLVRS